MAEMVHTMDHTPVNLNFEIPHVIPQGKIVYLGDGDGDGDWGLSSIGCLKDPAILLVAV